MESYKDVTIATRLYPDSSCEDAIDDVRASWDRFKRVCRACSVSDGLIATKMKHFGTMISLEEDYETETEELGVDILTIGVKGWHNVTEPLNAILDYVTEPLNAILDYVQRSSRYIMFVSAEVEIEPTVFTTMMSHMNEDTLVVGATLPGHAHRGNGTEVALEGLTCPWNTLAIWNVEKLWRTSFLSIAKAGMEEVAVVAVQQKLYGKEHAKAKLVNVPGVTWHTQFASKSRRDAHANKMEYKNEKATQMLSVLGLTGAVLHY